MGGFVNGRTSAGGGSSMGDNNERPDTLVLFSLAKVHRDSEGNLRTHVPTISKESLAPFLENFASVKLHTRVIPNHVDDTGEEVETDRLTVVPLPYYEGIGGYLRSIRRMSSALRAAIQDRDLHYGIWVPNHISPAVRRAVSKIGAPLLSIVVGDGSEVAKAIFPWPLKHVIAQLSLQSTRRVVRESTAVVYVTLETLQHKYPAAVGVPTLARTDLRIQEDLFSRPPKVTAIDPKRGVSVIAVGSQQQTYKGHDLLLGAIAHLQRDRHRIRATIVGDGIFHDSLVEQAKDLGIQDVNFVRSLDGSDEVARVVREHDIFIMPSRTEGMPRALLEAMAVGTLSLGSRVGGIPEVLSEECLFDPNSAEAIVAILEGFLSTPTLANECLLRQGEMIRWIHENHYGDKILTDYLGTWRVRTETHLT